MRSELGHVGEVKSSRSYLHAPAMTQFRVPFCGIPTRIHPYARRLFSFIDCVIGASSASLSDDRPPPHFRAIIYSGHSSFKALGGKLSRTPALCNKKLGCEPKLLHDRNYGTHEWRISSWLTTGAC
jgi:hypothetical protein